MVHSQVLKRMRLEDKVTTIKDSELGFVEYDYNGYNVIVNDNLPVDNTDPANPIYTTVLLKNGAFLYAPWNVADSKDVVFVKNEEADHGAGSSKFIQRLRMFLTLNGFSFTGTLSGLFPTIAELKDGNNWELVGDAKFSPLYIIKSKA